MSGNPVRTSSDAYLSRNYVESANSHIEGEVYDSKAKILAKMAEADCLVYRPSTGEAAILDSSGDLIIFQYDANPEIIVSGGCESAGDQC